MNNNVIDQIVTISQNFDKNIENDRDDRGLLSQNILNGLRNLVEHIALHIHNIDTKSNLNNDFKNLQIGIQNIKNKAKYTSIIKLHSFLQISTSHYTPEEEKSERLILKYMPYLYSLKELCKKDLKLDILHNINKFPINLDKLNAKYYENIANKIEQPINYEKSRSDKFYIQTIKPFIINDKIYYEITFTIAKNNISKFDKIIAFSKYNIPANYSVELKLYDTNIRLHKSILIIIITEWNISIRPCELKNFCSIFGLEENFNRNKEYENFMSVLKKYRITLFELVKLNNKEYLEIKSYFTQNSLKILFTCLDKARNIILNNKKGKNILSYILYNMNNAIIKKQKADQVNKRLSNLYLDNKCIPFEEMPFCTSLIKHNPKFIDLCECIEIENKKYELLARSIKNNSEINGFLYKNISDFKNTSKKDIYDLVKQYNENITYEVHKPKRHIEILYEKFLYINEYEDIVKHIIKQLKKFTKNGIDNYQQDVEKWLSSNQLDCKEKEKHLINLFHNSKLALIYGAAGTGKTTLIKHISHFFKNKTQLFLTNTNTAINNLKQRIDADKSYFYTLASYINNKKRPHSYFDVVIIDECSTINNQDMLKILEIIKCDILICVGDIYQIEAIRFGNWFLLAQKIFTKHQIELQNIYRTEDKELQNIWNKVRKFDNAILEFFSKNNISKKIEDFSFEKK